MNSNVSYSARVLTHRDRVLAQCLKDPVPGYEFLRFQKVISVMFFYIPLRCLTEMQYFIYADVYTKQQVTINYR